MERPSHIIFDTQSRDLSHRLPFIGLALSLQFAVFWLFMHGLAGHRIGDIIHDIVVVPVPQEKTVDPVTPPDPPLTQPERLTNVPPIFTIERDTGKKTIYTGEGEKQPPVITPPVEPDRAPVSNLSTHTVPPYPPVARRIGAEGKVTLRLTVTAEGRVNQVDIVTTSGNEDLDQAAQHWIVAHWTYKPALRDGVPAISHTLAALTFSLVNDR
jgi:periplasmic protein TonB